MLALMDRHMVAMYGADTRTTPGGTVVEAPGLVMCRTPRGTIGTNMAIVTGPIDPERLRVETDRVFRRHDRPFSIWTREHRDAALEERLRGAGFIEIHREPAMVLLPAAAPAAASAPAVAVRPVRDDAARRDYARIVAQAFAVYGAPEESTAEHFERLEAVTGPDVQAWLAYAGGRAVAGATLYMAHGVAGIGWVGTLPEVHRRGYGQAVTRTVIEDGLGRGACFVSLQASPMGAPMYERLGFTTPSHYRWFLVPE
jgi:GNAT superfamily N-acetyltransferase